MRLLNWESENLTVPTKALALALALTFAFTLACTKGGGITSSGSSSSIAGTLALTQVFPSAAGSGWTPILVSNRYYIKGLSITVTGTCTRGIATITVTDGGAGSLPSTPCAGDGSFSWSNTYAAGSGEGDKTLTFTALDSTGATITGGSAVQLVRVDNTPPSTPLITTPNGGTANWDNSTNIYSGSSNQFIIAGTCDVTTGATGGCDHLTGPGGVIVSQAGGAWTYTATIVDGTQTTFSFFAVDLAGNISGQAQQTVDWAPTVTAVLQVYSGGSFTDTQGSGQFVEASGYSYPQDSLDGVDSLDLVTGFNYITNLLRGL